MTVIQWARFESALERSEKQWAKEDERYFNSPRKPEITLKYTPGHNRPEK